ncbi:MAG: hypothetical protein ACKO4S_00810 [Snowella sp.]
MSDRKLPYFHRDRIFLISLCQLTAIATFPISIAIAFLNSVISTNCDRKDENNERLWDIQFE